MATILVSVAILGGVALAFVTLIVLANKMLRVWIAATAVATAMTAVAATSHVSLSIEPASSDT